MRWRFFIILIIKYLFYTISRTMSKLTIKRKPGFYLSDYPFEIYIDNHYEGSINENETKILCLKKDYNEIKLKCKMGIVFAKRYEKSIIINSKENDHKNVTVGEISTRKKYFLAFWIMLFLIYFFEIFIFNGLIPLNIRIIFFTIFIISIFLYIMRAVYFLFLHKPGIIFIEEHQNRSSN